MKIILIDPKKKTLEKIDADFHPEESNLQKMYEIIGDNTNMVQCVPIELRENTWIHLWCDEEGWIRGDEDPHERGLFDFQGVLGPTVGRAFLTGMDEDGNLCDVDAECEDVKPLISWHLSPGLRATEV